MVFPNKYSVQSAQDTKSLTRSFPGFLPPSVPVIELYSYVNVCRCDLVQCSCAFVTPVCVRLQEERQTVRDRDRNRRSICVK